MNTKTFTKPQRFDYYFDSEIEEKDRIGDCVDETSFHSKRNSVNIPYPSRTSHTNMNNIAPCKKVYRPKKSVSMLEHVQANKPLGDVSNTVDSRLPSNMSSDECPENISEAEADEGVPSLVHLLNDEHPINKLCFEGSQGSLSER